MRLKQDVDPQRLRRLPLLQNRWGERLVATYDRVDRVIVRFLEAWGLTLLRFALASVFIWFGALKVIGRSPVEDLVKETAYWLPGDTFVVVLGVWELIVGFGLLLGVGMRVVLLLFLLQMLGTFLVFVTQPELAFEDGNPLLLTTLGEFVVKNVVLIAAGLVLGSTVRRKREDRVIEGEVSA